MAPAAGRPSGPSPAAVAVALAARPLGPFTLATDVTDEHLVNRLTAVATVLPAGYGERLGLAPAAAGEVLLFGTRVPLAELLAADAATLTARRAAAGLLHRGLSRPLLTRRH